MVRLVLVMHDPMAAAFKDCVTHILGGSRDFTCFDILPNAEPELEIQKIKNWITRSDAQQPVIILCDLYGATPFNIAVKASDLAIDQGYNVSLLTGANICMLLKALTEAPDDHDLFIQKIQAGAQRGIIKIDTP